MKRAAGSMGPYLLAACMWYSEADVGPGAEAGIGAAGFRPRSRAHTRRWALGKRSVGTRRAASMQDTPPHRAIARAPRRAARRRRDSATTLPVADPPTVLAVSAEAASCAARAVLSDSVSCMLAARRVTTDRFPDGVPGAGREPSASPMTNASSVAAPEPTSDSNGPGADSDSGPGGDPHLAVPSRCAKCPPPRLGRRRARVRTR
eukprot:scaffold23502_cov73-Phaeocystis_antarctica.AAC.2